MRRNRRLNQRFACLARPLAADMPLDREYARRIVQFLAGVLADTHALATAGAGDVVGFVVDIRARQVRRQGRALWLLTLLIRWRIRLQLLKVFQPGARGPLRTSR